MIDLDKIENSVNQLMRMYPKDTRATQTIGDVHEIITSLRQAEKDAARYRRIKALAKVIECEEFDIDMLDGQDLDVMTDECIEVMNGSNN